MLKHIKNFDSCQIVKPFWITQDQEHNRSVFGGTITILIYLLSFSFFVYSINDWLGNNKLPKTTFNIKNSEDLTFQQEDILADFAYYPTQQEEIDPFDPKNIVLQAILQITTNDVVVQEYSLKYSQELSKMNTHQLVLDNVYLSYNTEGDKIQFTDYFLILAECQEKFLKSGEKCADQQTIDKFYSQSIKWFQVTFYEEQFNSKTLQMQKIPKRNSFILQENKTLYQENILQLANIFIDTGTIFSNIKEKQFLYKVQHQLSDISSSDGNMMFGVNASFILYINLSQLYTEQYIEYPKFQEILADIGSIVQLLYLLQIFPKFYNEKLFEQFYLNQIIKIYYSDFDDLNVKFSIFGQISQIIYKGQIQVGQQFEIWKKVYQNLIDSASNKISYIDLLYEVSRIQCTFFQQLTSNISLKEFKISSYYQEIENLIQNNSYLQVKNLFSDQMQSDVQNQFQSDENLFAIKNDFSQLSVKKQTKHIKINSINIT